MYGCIQRHEKYSFVWIYVLDSFSSSSHASFLFLESCYTSFCRLLRHYIVIIYSASCWPSTCIILYFFLLSNTEELRWDHALFLYQSKWPRTVKKGGKSITLYSHPILKKNKKISILFYTKCISNSLTYLLTYHLRLTDLKLHFIWRISLLHNARFLILCLKCVLISLLNQHESSIFALTLYTSKWHKCFTHDERPVFIIIIWVSTKYFINHVNRQMICWHMFQVRPATSSWCPLLSSRTVNL